MRGRPAAAQRWLRECLEDAELAAPASRCTTSSSARQRERDDARRRASSTFAPLLPDDDAPLDEQVQALALWCHGFLSGVGTTAPSVGRATAPQGRAARARSSRDFAEISRAGLSEDEAAGWANRTSRSPRSQEYVRVSVQIVFEELGAERGRAQTRDVH